MKISFQPTIYWGLLKRRNPTEPSLVVHVYFIRYYNCRLLGLGIILVVQNFFFAKYSFDFSVQSLIATYNIRLFVFTSKLLINMIHWKFLWNWFTEYRLLLWLFFDFISFTLLMIRAWLLKYASSLDNDLCQYCIKVTHTRYFFPKKRNS